MVDRWYSIAIQLEFRPVYLDRIKQNHQPHPVEEACQRMFIEWQNNTNNTSNSDLAKDLIKAVNDVEYAVHADKFEKV